MSYTSLEAYSGIQDSLPERRFAVLKQLLKYVHAWKQNPTAMELAQYMQTDRSNVSNRLSELEKGNHAVHQGPARTCERTGVLATTWILGPASGLELIVKALQKKVNVKAKLVSEIVETKNLLERFKERLEVKGDQRDFLVAITQRIEDLEAVLVMAAPKKRETVPA